MREWEQRLTRQYWRESSVLPTTTRCDMYQKFPRDVWVSFMFLRANDWSLDWVIFSFHLLSRFILSQKAKIKNRFRIADIDYNLGGEEILVQRKLIQDLSEDTNNLLKQNVYQESLETHSFNCNINGIWAKRAWFVPDNCPSFTPKYRFKSNWLSLRITPSSLKLQKRSHT